MLDCIGNNYADILFVPLETLANIEEAAIRSKAVESINKLGLSLDHNTIYSAFFPLVKRLASGDWFSSRVSACGLFSTCFNKLELSEKSEIIDIFSNLVEDDTPMVRRSVASSLSKLAAFNDQTLYNKYFFSANREIRNISKRHK